MMANILYGCAAFALVVIGILVIYVLVVLLPKIKATLARVDEEVIPKLGGVIENLDRVAKSIHELNETEIKPMMHNIQNLTGQLNEEIPKIGATFENVNGITASIQQLSETEIKGIAGNIQEITAKINEDVAKVDEVVNTTTNFTKDTIDKAEFYRDKLFVPIIDILSFWNAVKAGLGTIVQIQKKNEKGQQGGE
jgi:methyl-accepting chemotaxis protein